MLRDWWEHSCKRVMGGVAKFEERLEENFAPEVAFDLRGATREILDGGLVK